MLQLPLILQVPELVHDIIHLTSHPRVLALADLSLLQETDLCLQPAYYAVLLFELLGFGVEEDVLLGESGELDSHGELLANQGVALVLD